MSSKISGKCAGCQSYFERVSSRGSDKGLFCSQSCANKYNNSLRKAGKKTFACSGCGNLIRVERTTGKCQKCFSQDKRNRALAVSLGELRPLGLSQFHARIRGGSRAAYAGPKACLVCSYDLFFEVAHIKPVSAFDDSALLSEVNHPDNLVALCRNHHWEFDNGMLDLTSRLTPLH